MNDNKLINESNNTASQTDLELLTQTYDKIGIEYTIRDHTVKGWQLLFIGKRSDIYEPGGTYETGDVEVMMARHSFMEFKAGALVASVIK